MFEAADSSPLAWQADVGWLVRGGAEPAAWLERYGSRLLSAHVKDIARDGKGLDEDGWADVGHGIFDRPAFWISCRTRGARWMVVEHDMSGRSGQVSETKLRLSHRHALVRCS